MKKLIAICMIVMSLLGCAQNCKTVGYPVYNQETGLNDWVEKEVCTENKGFKWYDVLLFPVFVIAAVAGGASSVQRNVTDSPHYQAGGDSYVDYTKK